MSKNYYDTLGVSKNATPEEIKKAYRKLAHQHHPDKNSGGDATKFKEINEAYQTLGKEDKRSQYDKFGSTFSGRGGSAGGGFNYQDFARAQGGNPFGQGFNQDNVHFDFGGGDDLGDIFSSFFGGGGGSRSRQSQRGSDIELEFAIDFEEAVFGVEKNIDLQKKVTCDRCGGGGAEPGSKINTCKTCSGSGRVSRVQQTILGAFQSQSVCSDCQGEGKTYEKKCSQCSGAGTTRGSEKINIKIPAGIENGQSLKLAGRGDASSRGVAGDLYVRIKVRPSDKFERHGDSVLSKHHINLKQAILGDKIDVITVDGPVKLKIPVGTQSHTKFRLSGKGVPHLQSRGRGDHLVEVVVDIPKSISRQDKKMLEDMDI